MFGRDEDAILYRVRKKDLEGDSLIRRNRLESLQYYLHVYDADKGTTLATINVYKCL